MVSKSFFAPDQRFGIARVLVETLLGDLSRIFSPGEIDDGLAGPALHDAPSRREGSVGRLTGGCDQGEGEDQQRGERDR